RPLPSAPWQDPRPAARSPPRREESAAGRARPYAALLGGFAQTRGRVRESADHRGAAILARLDTHRAAMQLDEALDDGKAEAGTAPAPAIDARFEAPEHRFQNVRRHARAVVMHGKLHAPRHAAASQLHGTVLRRVVGGIGEEIVEDLADSRLVAKETLRRRRHVNLQSDRVLLQPLGDKL